MGFDGITDRKQEGFSLLEEQQTAWVQEIKNAGVTGSLNQQATGLRDGMSTLPIFVPWRQLGYPGAAGPTS